MLAHTFDSSRRLCFLPNTLFRSCVASDLRLRPSVCIASPATLLAVVFGFVSESLRKCVSNIDQVRTAASVALPNNPGSLGCSNMPSSARILRDYDIVFKQPKRE